MEEERTLSVSKGVFLFRNNFKTSIKTKKNKCIRNSQNTLFSSNLWYEYYFTFWDLIEEQINDLNNTIFSSVMSNLIEFIKISFDNSTEEIPTAALFTGINMPDHGTQFECLLKQLKKTTTPHVACLQSGDCQNIRHLMENIVNQFVNDRVVSHKDESDRVREKMYLKKSLLNLSVLQSWYASIYGDLNKRKPLVVIIPDFEGFNLQVLQKFILIISCYVKTLPFVLVFGIATDINTLHKSLPYKVSSRIRVKVFFSQRSVDYLNNVLEAVFFTCPFQLGGKVFNLFTELFLFYDLSVTNFIQNIKFAVADHFARGNVMTLCHLEQEVIEEVILEFSSEEFDSLRHFPSFKKFLEREPQEKQIKLLVDNDYFAQVILEQVSKTQIYIKKLHLFLKCLLVLLENLPRTRLGKQVREIYSIVISRNIIETAEYKECMKLLSFQSKDELVTKLTKIVKILSNDRNINVKDRTLLKSLKTFLRALNNIDDVEPESLSSEQEETQVELTSVSRWQFREKLLEMSKARNKTINKYEKLREEIIETLSTAFGKYLRQPETNCFHEIFFYDNISIKNHIIGSHRSAIHNALNDPQFYLRCKCCEIPNPCSIKHTMPDICVAYKLHLEYGKVINLYDWLQSFFSIVDLDDINDVKKTTVNLKMQARFTQAVSELEFLGFIKSSKRKADHVQRLTWGG